MQQQRISKKRRLDMYNIATIVTPDYIDRALTMFGSISEFAECELHMLVITAGFENHKYPDHANVKYYEMQDITSGPNGRINRLTFQKYKDINISSLPEIISKYDYLRWALKPGFTMFLLEQMDQVIFCDNDLFFYNDPSGIFDTCFNNDMTISPHWRAIDNGHTDEMKYNFMHGLYNGGFYTASGSAVNILDWWAESCCVECSADSKYSYVDQKYLDLLPLYFGDQVGILKHKGCNVAAWNRTYLHRSVGEKDEILVDGHEIVFIHYSPVTIDHIERGLDYLLAQHLITYQKRLIEVRVQLMRQGMVQFVSGNALNKEVI